MTGLGILFAFCGIVGAIALVLACKWSGNRARQAVLQTRIIQHDADFVEALPIAVALFDADDRLQQVNGKLLQLLPMAHALSHQRISRLEFFRVLAEEGIFVDAANRVSDFLTDVAARAHQRHIEWEVSLTDGRSLHFTERAMDSGGRLLSCVDITVQKQQSWALDEKSQLLNVSLRAYPVDADTRYI